jgi:hypothetical protein
MDIRSQSDVAFSERVFLLPFLLPTCRTDHASFYSQPNAQGIAAAAAPATITTGGTVLGAGAGGTAAGFILLL